MHRLKVASKETGKGRAPEHKPEWVAALEHNDMVQLGELAKHGFHPSIFEGHVTTLEINGKVDTWTPLGLACVLDNGSAVTLLLSAGAEPHEFFHRAGVGFNAMSYCRSHDKSFAHHAMIQFGVAELPGRH